MKNNFSIPFIEPVFKGDRFTRSPHLPVQAFPELIAYEAITRATAKELYFPLTQKKHAFQKDFKNDLINSLIFKLEVLYPFYLVRLKVNKRMRMNLIVLVIY